MMPRPRLRMLAKDTGSTLRTSLLAVAALALTALWLYTQNLAMDLSKLKSRVEELEHTLRAHKTSSENNVACLQCHSSPGFRSAVRQLIRDSAEIRQVWAAIRLLEHGVQKATGDWTPFWPVPPKECQKFPRQLPLLPYFEHVKDQMMYGPMHKMALLADKYQVGQVVDSFNCPKLTMARKFAVWDTNNITSMDLSVIPSNNFCLKANFGAGSIAFVQNGLLVKVVPSDGQEELHSQILRYVGKPVNTTALISFFRATMTTFYRDCQEPHYAFIQKLIIAEELLSSRMSGSFPEDFKFFASMGKVLLAQVHTGRMGQHRVGHVDSRYQIVRDFIPLDNTPILPDDEIIRLRPVGRTWDDMIKAAECLSKNIYMWGGIRFSRIDLYDVVGVVMLGEITLTPMGGHQYFAMDQSLALSKEMPFQ